MRSWKALALAGLGLMVLAGAALAEYRPPFRAIPSLPKISVAVPPAPSDEILPPKYSNFLRVHPLIKEAMVYDGARYDEWPIGMKRRLAEYLNIYESAGPYPYSGPPLPLEGSDSLRTVVSKEDDQNLYMAHIAFSLYLEVNRLVPWSITTYDLDSLSLLFRPEHGLSDFSYLHCITAWNPRYCYEFLAARDMIRSTQAETIYAFTGWGRKYLWHWLWESEGISSYYGYAGSPPIDQILSPRWKEEISTWSSQIGGCYGTSALYRAVLRSINIPCQVVITDLGAPHAALRFPSVGLGVIHSDDLYASRYGLYGSVPTSEIFVSDAELSEYIDVPSDRGMPSTPTEIKIYDYHRRLGLHIYNYLGDFWVQIRCRELAPETNPPTSPGTLESMLLGYYMLTDEEKDDIIRRIDAIIEREGGPRATLARIYEFHRSLYLTSP